jgi:hypothetical protein
VTPPTSTLPKDTHEWVSFPDPDEDRTWIFDVTFLESNWTCIFGRGCQGVLTGPAPELIQGCCSYGAHFTGKADVKRVAAAAATLTDDQWQLRSKALPQGRRRALNITRTNKDGSIITRNVQGACIFLNRPGFAGGPGCALHRAALERGQVPLELKPDVCWQLPLRREDSTADDGWVTSTVRQWDRRDWGEGGHEFHWWCTESHEAFVGEQPVWKELAPELQEMVGKNIYKRLVRYLVSRTPGAATAGGPANSKSSSRNGRTGDSQTAGGVDFVGPTVVPVQHPALRRH